jgi:hypothetical protein
MESSASLRQGYALTGCLLLAKGNQPKADKHEMPLDVIFLMLINLLVRFETGTKKRLIQFAKLNQQNNRVEIA